MQAQGKCLAPGKNSALFLDWVQPESCAPRPMLAKKASQFPQSKKENINILKLTPHSTCLAYRLSLIMSDSWLPHAYKTHIHRAPEISWQLRCKASWRCKQELHSAAARTTGRSPLSWIKLGEVPGRIWDSIGWRSWLCANRDCLRLYGGLNCCKAAKRRMDPRRCKY